MNIFGMIAILLLSLGLSITFVFMLLCLFTENLRDSISKSLVAFIIMLIIFSGSILVALPRENNEESQNATAMATQNDDMSYSANESEEAANPSTDVSTDSENNEPDYVNEETPYIAETQTTEVISNIIAEPSTESNNILSELQVHFIDVGQGDCTFITCNGYSMLIDAGNNDKGKAVEIYIKKQGVNSLDYVIGTHPDADHIGGMDVIMTNFNCKQIILPDVTNDTNTYRDVIDTMDYKRYTNTLPIVGSTYSLGDATFTIIAPNGNYDDTNNYSIGIRLVHGENSFVFTGDAEAEAETDMLRNGLELSADVLKIAHHGSSSSTTKSFLNAVNPMYAVISCGEENTYGHPAAETLNTLRNAGVKVFRTDEQGSIIAVSNGIDISFNCAPSESWKAGEVIFSENTVIAPTIVEEYSEQQETAVTYVLNTNTKKFHHVTCSSVGDIAEKNKEISNQSRYEIMAQGYVPCKRCNP